MSLGNHLSDPGGASTRTVIGNGLGARLVSWGVKLTFQLGSTTNSYPTAPALFSWCKPEYYKIEPTMALMTVTSVFIIEALSNRARDMGELIGCNFVRG